MSGRVRILDAGATIEIGAAHHRNRIPIAALPAWRKFYAGLAARARARGLARAAAVHAEILAELDAAAQKVQRQNIGGGS